MFSQVGGTHIDSRSDCEVRAINI